MNSTHSPQKNVADICLLTCSSCPWATKDAKGKIDIKLVLIVEGKPEKNIRAQVEELGLLERVIFIGFKKNPYPYIKQAKGLVLTSDFEGLPTMIPEAISLDAPLQQLTGQAVSGKLLIIIHHLWFHWQMIKC